MKNTNNAVNDIARANVLRQEIAACKAAHGHLPQSQRFINATRVRVREEELASLAALQEIREHYGVEECVRCELLSRA